MSETIPGLFVVGTDTGVGKTRVAAGIARAMVGEARRVGVLKPVATGAVREGDAWKVDDADALIAAIGGDATTAEVCPIAFAEPLAPPVAARRSGRLLGADEVVDATRAAIRDWQTRRGAAVMVVEGVGGLLCPLAEGITVADLKREHTSLLRKPSLAHVFYRRGLIEQWGRRKQKIVELCRAAGHPEPELSIDQLLELVPLVGGGVRRW